MTTLDRMAARRRMDEVPRRISSNDRQLRALFQIGEMVEYDRRTATCTVEVAPLASGEDDTVGELEPAFYMRDVIYTSQHFSGNAIIETLPSVRTYEQENTGEFVLTSSGSYERYDARRHGSVPASSRYRRDKAGETVLVTMFGGMAGPKYAIADLVPADTAIRNLRNVVNAVASVDYANADGLSTRAVIAAGAADGIVDVVYNPVDTGGDGDVATAEGYVTVTLHNAQGMQMRRLRIDGDGTVNVLCAVELRDDDIHLTGDNLTWNGATALIPVEYSQAAYDALPDDEKLPNIFYVITS